MQSFTITVTRQQLEAARATLNAQGTHIAGDDAQVSHDGVTLGIAYVEPTLTITTIKKPFFVSQGEIQSEVTGWFKS